MRKRTLLGFAISLVLLYVLFRPVDWGAVLGALLDANLLLLAPALALYFTGVWVRSFRWRLLLSPLARLPTGKLFRVVVIGFTANDLLPLRLGEIVRAILLARSDGVPVGATLATIVVERVLDGLVLCGFLALGWLLVPLNGLERAAWLGAALFLGATAGLWLATRWPALALRLAERLLRLAPLRLRARILRAVQAFVNGLAVVRRGRLFGAALLLSLLAWTLEAGLYYVVMLGFGLGVGPLAAVLGMAAANLVTLVPSSPGYIGTFHVALQRVLVELFGVGVDAATSYTLVVHAALIVPVVLLGLYLLWRSDLTLGELRAWAVRRPSGEHRPEVSGQASGVR